MKLSHSRVALALTSTALLSLSSTIVPVSGQNDGICSFGFYNGSYYEIVNDDSFSWTTGREYARRRSICGSTADLAVIKRVEVNAFIMSLLFSCTGVAGAWIGMADVEEEGKFKWVDGTNATYVNWCRGEGPYGPEPNDYENEDHVHIAMNFGGCWNDISDVEGGIMIAGDYSFVVDSLILEYKNVDPACVVRSTVTVSQYPAPTEHLASVSSVRSSTGTVVEDSGAESGVLVKRW